MSGATYSNQAASASVGGSPPRTVVQVLAECPWFRKLDERALQDVLREGVPLTLPKGRNLFRTGDLSHDVYIVVAGRIGISTIGMSGRDVVFREHGPGDAFGEIAAIDGLPRSANANALVATQMLRLPAGAFRRLLAKYPTIAEEVLTALARLVRLLSDRIAENGARAAVRIVAALLHMAEEAAPSTQAVRVEIDPPPTDEDLAARYDSHREAVNRTIGELKRRGLIERSRSSFVVADLPGLRRHLADLRR